MIITTQKDKNTVLGLLKNDSSIFLVGCGSCATACQTGGENEIIDLRDFLQQNGKTVTGYVIPQETCQKLLVRKDFINKQKELDAAGCVIVMSCGAGVQSVVDLVEDKPVYSMLDTLFLGNVSRFG